MNKLWLVVFVILAGALIWGCVEELDPGTNLTPKIWFTRAPDDGEVIYKNAVDFEWTATDWDDDLLATGSTFIRLEPSMVEWKDAATDSEYTFVHPEGWVRLYENTYQILDLPDTSFDFGVKVMDGRGADSIAVRHFIVRYDADFPLIDSVRCPDPRPPSSFCHTYKIYAHDVARTPRAATPVELLEYSYRFVGPAPLPAIDSDPEWSNENWRFEACVDGQTYKGEYRFKCKVRDRAGNTSPEFVCKFEVGN